MCPRIDNQTILDPLWSVRISTYPYVLFVAYTLLYQFILKLGILHYKKGDKKLAHQSVSVIKQEVNKVHDKHYFIGGIRNNFVHSIRYVLKLIYKLQLQVGFKYDLKIFGGMGDNGCRFPLEEEQTE